MKPKDKLTKAMEGDINAFHSLFSEFKPELKSFLYRLLSDRNLVDDFYHDTFIKAFDKLSTFNTNYSLKNWCFTLASNMCIDYLRKSKRWDITIKEDIKKIGESSPAISQALLKYQSSSYEGEFEMKEHIDFCFTCMAKTIEIDKQIVIILKDIYEFEVKDIVFIMGYSYANVKKILHQGRKIMNEIFNQKCALVNKNGVCHQCTELNGSFNPKQNQQKELLKLKMVKEAENGKKEKLYKMRTELIKKVDPVTADKGSHLHDFFMDVARYSAGEIKESSFF